MFELPYNNGNNNDGENILYDLNGNPIRRNNSLNLKDSLRSAVDNLTDILPLIFFVFFNLMFPLKFISRPLTLILSNVISLFVDEKYTSEKMCSKYTFLSDGVLKKSEISSSTCAFFK